MCFTYDCHMQLHNQAREYADSPQTIFHSVIHYAEVGSGRGRMLKGTFTCGSVVPILIYS